MKCYPDYTDKGIKWLGEIPANWKIKKLKWIVKEKLKYGANEIAELDDPLLPRYIRITDFGENGNLRRDTFKSLPFERAEGYFLTDGDVLFARSGATVGKTFQFKNYDGKACFAGYLIKASPDNSQVKSDYLYLYTKSSSYENWKNSIFSQATIQNIGADKYNYLEVPIPTITEQDKIALFLNHKTKQIDTLIEKKQKQIDLLTEQRAAIINKAVTKGLDPNVEMKDSGIEWLGERPEHWINGVKLSRVAKEGKGTFVNGPFGSDLLTSEFTDSGVPVIYIRDIKLSIYKRVSTSFVTEEKAEQLDFCRVDPGDLLIAKVGDPPGTAAIYPETEPAGVVTQDVIRIKADTQVVLPDYLLFMFNSPYGRAAIELISVESTRNRIGLGDLKKVRVLLPPIDEQRKIVSFLYSQTIKIDTLIHQTERVITFLEEYRTTLISDVVTGKIDVREEVIP